MSATIRVSLLGTTVALALLVALSFAVASAPQARAGDSVQPRRVGPIYVVATGQGTTLRIWRTTDGYCVLPFRLELSDRAMCVPRALLERRGGAMFACLCRQRHGTALVAGTVKPIVRRGERTDGRGVAAVQLYPAPPGLSTSLRFFRTIVRVGSPPKWSVNFYDRRDNLVGSVGQGSR